MENDFKQNDFEHFLKENADQYRMFPSEKVWKGIHNTLHVRRRWYGIGLTFLILTTGIVSWVMLSTSGRNTPVVSSLPAITNSKPVAEVKEDAPVVIVPVRKPDDKLSFVTSTTNLRPDLIADESGVINEQPNLVHTRTSLPLHNDIPALLNETATAVSEQLIAAKPVIPKANNYKKPVDITIVEDKTIEPNMVSVPPVLPVESKETDISDLFKTKVNGAPYTIESVINYYRHSRRKNSIAFEVYVTPTVSYRDLKENKEIISTARNASIGASNPSYSADINSVVTHKPDFGLQLGFRAGLPLTKNIKLIGGLQFNVNKYDIRAYTYPTEFATITLSNASGGVNTLSTRSDYRNIGGPKENWLHNLYFSAAIPVGLEVKLLGNRKNYFGVSATAQPTYMLENEAYLLSTDYKNYTEVPSLTRKWNVNAGFEMFAGLSTGSLKWKVGPQARYQTMSSFKEKYPIKEHLFDFGLKIGLMLNK